MIVRTLQAGPIPLRLNRWRVEVLESDRASPVEVVAVKECDANDVPHVLTALWLSHVVGFLLVPTVGEQIDDVIRAAMACGLQTDPSNVVDARDVLAMLIEGRIVLPGRDA